MIDVSKNFMTSFMTEKMSKAFQVKKFTLLSDKQISSIFIDFLKQNRKDKFYFTKNTVDRIMAMDISKVNPSSLSFLYDKYKKEFSFCYLEKENISFCYSIDINSIKIVVFNGTKKSVLTRSVEGHIKTESDSSGFTKAICGSAIISFPLNQLTIIPSNALHYIGNNKKPSDAPYEYQKDLIKASKDDEYLKNLTLDMQIKSDTIFLAIKAFVFLKTASVIDKTFIADNNKLKTKNKYGIAVSDNSITVINSFYNESINVINPFSVSGHFRNQPKKDEDKKDIIEIIYIDSFMKQGYNRQAKILTENKENEKF